MEDIFSFCPWHLRFSDLWHESSTPRISSPMPPSSEVCCWTTVARMLEKNNRGGHQLYIRVLKSSSKQILWGLQAPLSFASCTQEFKVSKIKPSISFKLEEWMLKMMQQRQAPCVRFAIALFVGSLGLVKQLQRARCSRLFFIKRLALNIIS